MSDPEDIDDDVVTNIRSVDFDIEEQSSLHRNLVEYTVSDLTEINMHNVPESDIVSTEVQRPGTRGGDGSSSYVVYTVVTKRTDPRENSSVERRFKDFVWLRESLRRSSKGIIVPPLPRKNKSMELSLNIWGIKSKTRRSSVEFVKQRQRGLASFLKHVVSHEKLKSDIATQVFLCANRADIKLARVNSPTKQDDSLWNRLCRSTGTITESLGLGKSNERTEVDVRMKNIGESNRKATVCLTQFFDAFTQIEKRQLQISQSLFNVGVASQGFSKLIGGNLTLNHDHNCELTDMLGGLAKSVENVSNLMSNMVQEVSIHCSEPLFELKRTGPVVDSILKDRASSLLAAEECKSRLEKIKTQMGKGDPELVTQLKKEAMRTDAELKEVTTRVLTEYESFKERRLDSLKKILCNFVDSEVQFHEQSIAELKKLQAHLEDD